MNILPSDIKKYGKPHFALIAALVCAGCALLLSLVVVADILVRVTGSEKPRWGSVVVVISAIGFMLVLIRPCLRSWRERGGFHFRETKTGSSGVLSPRLLTIKRFIIGGLLAVGGLVCATVTRLYRPIPGTYLHAATGMPRLVYYILGGVAWTLLIGGWVLIMAAITKQWGSEGPKNAGHIDPGR